MGRRTEGTEENEGTTKRGVLIGSGGSNWVWWRIEGRVDIIGITRDNFKVMGRKQTKEKSISRNGPSERYIQGRDGGGW